MISLQKGIDKTDLVVRPAPLQSEDDIDANGNGFRVLIDFFLPQFFTSLHATTTLQT